MRQDKSFAIYEKRHASGNVGYRVDLGVVKGKRSFKSFSNRKDAEDFRDRHLNTVAQKHPNLLADIDDITRHEVLSALAKLKQYRATISQAVDFFLKHSRPAIVNATISQVIDDFEKVKKKGGRSTKYLESCRATFFEPFRDHFKNCVITDITSHQCDKYIFRRKTWNATSQNTHIRHLSVLFNFAIAKGYATLNPFDKVERPKKLPNTASQRVVKVADVIKILQYAYTHDYKPECAALVLTLFCGVRADEVTDLTWDNIHLEEKKPVVVLEMTKTDVRRVNEIPSNAVEWLQKIRNKGKITGAHFEGRMRYLRKASKSGFKQNSARICFASYHVAKFEDPQKTSLLLGHRSPYLLWSTYRALVTKSAAESYWKITPDYKTEEPVPPDLIPDGEIKKKRAKGIAAALNTGKQQTGNGQEGQG